MTAQLSVPRPSGETKSKRGLLPSSQEAHCLVRGMASLSVVEGLAEGECPAPSLLCFQMFLEPERSHGLLPPLSLWASEPVASVTEMPLAPPMPLPTAIAHLHSLSLLYHS